MPPTQRAPKRRTTAPWERVSGARHDGRTRFNRAPDSHQVLGKHGPGLSVRRRVGAATAPRRTAHTNAAKLRLRRICPTGGPPIVHAGPRIGSADTTGRAGGSRGPLYIGFGAADDAQSVARSSVPEAEGLAGGRHQKSRSLKLRRACADRRPPAAIRLQPVDEQSYSIPATCFPVGFAGRARCG